MVPYVRPLGSHLGDTEAEKVPGKLVCRSGQIKPPGISCVATCPLTLMLEGGVFSWIASVLATQGTCGGCQCVCYTRTVVASVFATRGTYPYLHVLAPRGWCFARAACAAARELQQQSLMVASVFATCST